MPKRQAQPWNFEEDELLWKAMSESGHLTKEELSTLLPQRKSMYSLRRVNQLRLQGGPIPRKYRHGWTNEDDQKLLSLVADENKLWSSIAETMGSNITAGSCIARYKHLSLLNPQVHKARTSNRWMVQNLKKAQLSEGQIEQYRQLLHSQTLIGKSEEPLDAEVIAKMREDRGRGKTYRQIAQAYSLTEAGARHHCTKSLEPNDRWHRRTVEDYFNLWYANMVDKLPIREVSTRFGLTISTLNSRVKLMRLSGLWLKEDGTLTKRTLSESMREAGDEEEYPVDDNTKQPGDKDDTLAYDSTQVNIDNELEQDLRARDCIKTDHNCPTHFESTGGTVRIKEKMDDLVESSGRWHDQGLSIFRDVPLDTRADFATKVSLINHETRENDEAVRTEEHAILQIKSPSLIACEDDSSDKPRNTLHPTVSNTETHMQFQQHGSVEAQDVDSIVIKPSTMTSQSKVKGCPRPLIDDLEEFQVQIKAECNSGDGKEILNHTKKRVSQEDEPEQKPVNIKRRKRSVVRSNPFTVKAVTDGEMAEVQPQELWLNASQIYKLPSIGRLPLFAEVLGQRNSTWIAELIEAREYEHRCHVLVQWMYRPRDLPAKLRNLKDRGKSELILSDHFGIIDVECIMRTIEVIDWRANDGSPPHNHFSQSGPYYFRQTYNCLKKELSIQNHEKA